MYDKCAPSLCFFNVYLPKALLEFQVSLLIDWLGRYARFVEHLAIRNVAQGAPLGGGLSFMFTLSVLSFFVLFSFDMLFRE